MANWHPTIDLTELTEQDPKAITVAGDSIALCLIDGQVQAFNNSCPHAGLPLDGGAVEGCVITCPFHGYTFDMCSGKNTTFDNDPALEKFPVRIVDGKIEIQI